MMVHPTRKFINLKYDEKNTGKTDGCKEYTDFYA